MRMTQAAALDVARQTALEDVAALASDCCDGDAYELALITRAREISAKDAPTLREWRELGDIHRRLAAYQAIEDPNHRELHERHTAVRRSWDVTPKEAFVLLQYSEKRARKVRAA